MNDTQSPSERIGAVLILGLGETGEAAARWLARSGVRLVLVDTRPLPPGAERLRTDLPADLVQWHLGQGLVADWLVGVESVVLSPGLSPLAPDVATFLKEARCAQIEIIGEIELFARALKALEQTRSYQPQVLGVTGTNGKTTVTALTRHMLDACGIKARAAGNIGPAALTALMVALDKDDLPEVWVLELSSFQLYTTDSLSMKAAVVLNVTQDHLDWHGDFAAYCAAKARIFEQAQLHIVNRDDPYVVNMVGSLDQLHVRSFGRDTPVLVHDAGFELNHDVRWLASAQPTEFDDAAPKVSKRSKAQPPAPRAAGRLARLMPADALPMAGLHNAMNVLAAGLLARAVGGSWACILRAASHYEGEPHRMQFVRTVRGIDFYNDSKGTNVGATVAGVQGLRPQVVLIAGGQAKGQDFAPLAAVLAKRARAVVLIGQDAGILHAAFEAVGVTCLFADDLTLAVARAFEQANEGDAVVLSPACASFDMFRNYPHRGDMFVQAVQALALSQGEVA